MAHLSSKGTAYLTGALLSVFNLTFGYYLATHLGITNPLTIPMVLEVYKWDLVDDMGAITTLFGLTNGLFALGLLIGNLISTPLTNLLGRRPLSVYIDIYGIVVIWLHVVANIPIYILTRLLVGIYCAVLMPLHPTMMFETYPGVVCAFANTMSGVFTNLGLLLAFVTQNVLSFEQLGKQFRVILILPCILCGVRLLATIFLFRRETPSHLFAKYKDEPEKLKSEISESLQMVYLKEKVTSKYVDQLISMFRAFIAVKPKEEIVDKPPEEKLICGLMSRQMFAALLNASAIQLGGIGMLTVYSNLLFANIASDPLTLTLITGIGGLVGALIGIWTTKALGRRTLLMWGIFIQGTALTVMFFATIVESFLLLAVFIFIYMTVWGGAVGAVLFTHIAEIVPPKGIGIASSWNSVLQIVFSFLLPVVIIPLNIGMLLIFAGFCFMLFILKGAYTVETMDKNPLEIVQAHRKRPRFFTMKTGVSHHVSRIVSHVESEYHSPPESPEASLYEDGSKNAPEKNLEIEEPRDVQSESKGIVKNANTRLPKPEEDKEKNGTNKTQRK